MTRINTNVASLIGRNTLGRSNASLNEALTRLSTGLRINTGKDDPAGLIASENLRSDITSIRKAISNTDRATQVIATADSALGQVSSLLNDIRGLVTESANAGALSEEQIEANQLQVDSSLEALNRIAQTTTFQGRRLLDGSLDFITSAGNNFSEISDLKIDQANLGASGSVAVDVEVSTAATQAAVDVSNIPSAKVAANGAVSFNVRNGSATPATVDVTLGEVTTAPVDAAADFSALTDSGTLAGSPTFNDNGLFRGAAGDNLTITFAEDNSTVNDVSSLSGNTLTITVGTNGVANGGTIDLDQVFQDLRDTNDSDFTDVFTYADGDISAGDYTVTDGGAGGDDGLSVTFGSGADAVTATDTILVTADPFLGADANDFTITFAEGDLGATGTASATKTGDGTYTVTINNNATKVGGVTHAEIATAIQGLDDFSTAAANDGTASYEYRDNAPPATVNVGATQAGVTDEAAITFDIDATASAGLNGNLSIDFAFSLFSGTQKTNVVNNGNSSYTIQLDNDSQVSAANIKTALESIDEIDTATLTAGATETLQFSYDQTAVEAVDSALTGGADAGILVDAVIELAGATGSEVFNLEAGTSINELVNQIQLVSDATGVTATANGSTLELRSTEYGTDSIVDLKVISESTGGTLKNSVGEGLRSVGTDIVATVNGVSANGDGNELSINTSTLDLTTSLTAGFTGTSSFTVTGGGALFQLGPDVVSNQQARLGITSVNTAALGGVSGLLYQLGSGGTADLDSGTNLGAEIVNEAIDQVTGLRGRLGAFQRTTLETNKNALNDTLVNLTEAESSIRDADFAVESAKLTRAQILVQSGTNVLGIANQNPQNVLALLR